MKYTSIILIFIHLLSFVNYETTAAEKPRVFVLTDIENEPDDDMSMVRFLVKFQNGTVISKWEEYATHIQNHGNLGKVYPKYNYGVEGDTPEFLHILLTDLITPTNQHRRAGVDIQHGDYAKTMLQQSFVN